MFTLPLSQSFLHSAFNMHVLSVLYNKKFCFQFNSGICYVNSFSFSCSKAVIAPWHYLFSGSKMRTQKKDPIGPIQIVRVHVQMNQMRKYCYLIWYIFIFLWVNMTLSYQYWSSRSRAHLLKENLLSRSHCLAISRSLRKHCCFPVRWWLTALGMRRSFRW